MSISSIRLSFTGWHVGCKRLQQRGYVCVRARAVQSSNGARVGYLHNVNVLAAHVFVHHHVDLAVRKPRHLPTLPLCEPRTARVQWWYDTVHAP